MGQPNSSVKQDSYIAKVPEDYNTSWGYLPPIMITLDLLKGLKSDSIKLIPGQWLYSKRDKKLVKFVYSGLILSNDIVKPHVYLSYPIPGETILRWNDRFSKDLTRVKRVTARLKREPKVNTNRKVFIRPPKSTTTLKDEKPIKQPLFRRIWNEIKIFLTNII